MKKAPLAGAWLMLLGGGNDDGSVRPTNGVGDLEVPRDGCDEVLALGWSFNDAQSKLDRNRFTFGCAIGSTFALGDLNTLGDVIFDLNAVHVTSVVIPSRIFEQHKVTWEIRPDNDILLRLGRAIGILELAIDILIEYGVSLAGVGVGIIAVGSDVGYEAYRTGIANRLLTMRAAG